MYRKWLSSNELNNFCFTNHQGKVSFGSKNPHWPTFLEILLRALDISLDLKEEKLKKGGDLTQGRRPSLDQDRCFSLFVFILFYVPSPTQPVKGENHPLKLGMRNLRGTEMKTDSRVGQGGQERWVGGHRK